MILGYALLILALAATVAASVLFVRSRRPGGAGLLRPARALVLTATAGIVGASVYLSYLLFTHQFQVKYVAEYSARRSADWYLFAAFWGGQEGSILLWAFWTAILGSVLAYRAAGKEGRVWPIFSVIQVFLLGLLLLKCPFALGEGPVPTDGKGLNPLLENYWMVIHPPMLFLGFSSLAIPYVWTVYGLITRDWDGWIKAAFPWTLFSFAMLGFGIALGGYWAYETLGWGGFWAWDPVENSSLVPWLFLTGLLHGIPIQRANGGYKITNLLLGFLPFSFMVYGTFLTRTGLLGDFSVHSFSSLGMDGFYVLLSGIAVSVLVPLGLIVARFRRIPKPPAYERVATREFGYFLASALLGLVGLITAVGMSAPLITKIWTEKGAAAQPSFHNQASFPLGILLLLDMAATPYFAWRATNVDDVLKKLFPAYALAILLTLGMLLLGGRHPWMLLLFATATFAVLTNVLLILPRLRRREGRRTVGGFVAHAGAAMALAGVACLVAFSKDERVTLVKDVPADALGYQITYLGMTSQPFDRENKLRFKVEKNGKAFEGRSSLYIAPMGGKDELFGNPPAISRNLWGDLYLAHFRGPMSADEKSLNSGVHMKVEDEKTFGDYRIKFWGLEFDEKTREAMKQGKMDGLTEIKVSALIDVYHKGEKHSLAPGVIKGMAGDRSIPVMLPGTENVVLTVEPDFPRAMTLTATNWPDKSELVMMDVSTKPMIWLVWMGTLLYTFGGLIAYRRRASEAGVLGEDHDEKGTPEPTPDRTLPRRERRRASRQTSPEPARASSATLPRR